MKKSKLLLVTSLTLILCLLCVTSTTFSWFTRPKELKGNSISWGTDENPLSYPVSNGSGVKITTYKSTDDGITFDEPVTDFNNTKTGLSKGNRIYYRTDIENSGSTAQNVSLYLSSLSFPSTSRGSFYLGVNGPLKTYKKYGKVNEIIENSRVENYINKQNVYLGLHKDEMDQLEPKVSFIHSWGSSVYSSDCAWKDRVVTGRTGNWKIDGKWSNQNQYFNIFAMNIDYRSEYMQFVAKNDDGSDNYYDIPQPAISDYNTIIFYQYDSSYIAEATKSGTAAGIEKFYSSANVKVGTNINLAAIGHSGTLSYSSSNAGVATVTSAGLVSGLKEGTAIITVTSTGAYGDVIKATCTVTVYKESDNNFSDVPIVTNLKVGAKTEDGNTVESVYWYIKNDSNADGLTYNIPSIYLTS